MPGSVRPCFASAPRRGFLGGGGRLLLLLLSMVKGRARDTGDTTWEECLLQNGATLVLANGANFVFVRSDSSQEERLHRDMIYLLQTNSEPT